METNPYHPPAEIGESVSRTVASAMAERRRRQREWLGSWPVVVATSTSQLFICAVIVFGDIGFDHPGRFGLDFEHFLLLAGLQICLMLLSVVLAIWQRRWAFLAVPVIVVLLAFAAYMRPVPRVQPTIEVMVGNAQPTPPPIEDVAWAKR